jgi:hypothetical protein
VRDGLQLITVPACDEHNQGRSTLDERFREFIAFTMKKELTPLQPEIWRRTVKGIRRNPERLASYLKKIQWFPKEDVQKLYLEAEPFHKGVEWICRGLYWLHTNRPLPLDVPFSVHMMDLDAVVPDQLRWNELSLKGSVGKQFGYRGGIVQDRPHATVWFLGFHMSVVAVAFSGWSDSDTQELSSVP